MKNGPAPKGDERGSAALTTILILPVLLLALAGALELGALRVVAEKARGAADLAAIVAIGDQDDVALAASGAFRPSADAEAVARAYFALNLQAIADMLAATPEEVAARADIAVFAEPGRLDERTGRRYERPAVRVAATVPVRTPAFAALLLPPVTPIEVVAASVAR